MTQPMTTCRIAFVKVSSNYSLWLTLIDKRLCLGYDLAFSGARLSCSTSKYQFYQFVTERYVPIRSSSRCKRRHYRPTQNKQTHSVNIENNLGDKGPPWFKPIVVLISLLISFSFTTIAIREYRNYCRNTAIVRFNSFCGVLFVVVS
ncbi:hypothetical protein BpHYR1_043967 [Brachionus plicatilis]|uniref:Uncharacterized protein n=1 Tax=Brachionus plicatilis TaxID=10195 RepID=A0A3M7PWZ4_BRAPC|nr:hypothetical protein BpHYR1_043967 [Brachionus plicatilis]